MSKREVAAREEAPPSGLAKEARLPPWGKALISLILIAHLTAVFAAPFAFACNAEGSSSPFADALRRMLWPYISAMYLAHGYAFFAPNPGPSHLVDYQVEFADGRPPLTGRFPDLATERPRLLYHRYFMLSEALNNRYTPPEPPPEPSPPALTATAAERARYRTELDAHRQLLARWQHDRAQYEAMRRSIAEHLVHEHGGSRATLTRVEHRLVLPDEADASGGRLDAPETYVVLPESSSRGERP